MRVASVLIAVSAALATTFDVANAVDACGACAAGKTCILKDTSYTVATPSSSIELKFCNFEEANSAAYKLSFKLQRPLACDPDGELLPTVTKLTPKGTCTKENCIVDATLEQELDWAVVLANNGEQNSLQVSINDGEVVDVAKLSKETGSTVIEGFGESAAKATTCTTEFGVRARLLSRMDACNVVELCSGKPGDTTCPTSLSKTLTVKNVTCEESSCRGTVALTEPLPCSASSADSGALLMNVKVGNGAASGYARIATLTSPGAPTIAGVTKAEAGSKMFLVESDATCLPKGLEVTVSDAKVTEVGGSSEEISVAIDSAFTTVGEKRSVTIDQCGATSQPFPFEVAEASEDPITDSPASSDSDDNGSAANGGEVGQAGKTSTQTSNTTTGLPYGLYIGIGVGVLAFVGFVFECTYHKRKQRQGTHSGGPATHGAGHSAV